jgi:chloramphenicol O-acetyltransferase type A
MRQIDIQTWERREHFNFFRNFDHPHFNMCANVDLTKFYPAAKKSGHSFTVALMYILTRAANAIPEFRLRFQGEEVFEYEVVHPSVTILVDDNRFSFSFIDYVEDFKQFAPNAEESIARVKENLTLEDPPDRDRFLFMTSIPWVSFTSFMHPIDFDPPDSIPRFAWGKTFKEGDSLKMPLSVQAHHALMDGVHMGRYYIQVQEDFDQFDRILGE